MALRKVAPHQLLQKRRKASVVERKRPWKRSSLLKQTPFSVSSIPIVIEASRNCEKDLEKFRRSRITKTNCLSTGSKY